MSQTASFTLDQFECALAEFDVDTDGIRADYSGRGMYGTTCFGVVCAIGQAGLVALAIAQAVADTERLATEGGDSDASDVIADAAQIVRTMSTDSMGLSAIVYFPGWTLAD